MLPPVPAPPISLGSLCLAGATIPFIYLSALWYWCFIPQTFRRRVLMPGKVRSISAFLREELASIASGLTEVGCAYDLSHLRGTLDILFVRHTFSWLGIVMVADPRYKQCSATEDVIMHSVTLDRLLQPLLFWFCIHGISALCTVQHVLLTPDYCIIATCSSF